MKKTYFILAAAAAMVAATACDSKSKTEASDETPVEEATAIEYSGVLPAADADGVNYYVALTAESDTTGTFSMTEDYIQGDTIGQSFTSAGKYSVIENEGQKYVVLTQDAANVTYFRCDGDSAITMVSADLTPAISDLNYTLNRTK